MALRAQLLTQFFNILSRSSLGKVMNHTFSLGTRISVFMLPSHYSPVVHLDPAQDSAFSAFSAMCSKANMNPRDSWNLVGWKVTPPKLKSPSISVAIDNQVGKSRKCPVRRIWRCRVKMFEDRGLLFQYVLNCSKFFLFANELVSVLWCHGRLQPTPVSKSSHGESSGAQAGLEQNSGLS